jgi:hypothetical protein
LCALAPRAAAACIVHYAHPFMHKCTSGATTVRCLLQMPATKRRGWQFAKRNGTKMMSSACMPLLCFAASNACARADAPHYGGRPRSPRHLRPAGGPGCLPANQASIWFLLQLLCSGADTALPLSVHKLKEVYQETEASCRSRWGWTCTDGAAAAAAGGPAAAAAAPAATFPSPAAASGHEAPDDALSGSEDEPPLPSTSHLQLALLPGQAVLPAQTGSLVPRGERTPMAHPLSLVPPKRKFTPGVCCCLQQTLLTAADWFTLLQPLLPAQAASLALRARTRAWQAARISRLRSCRSWRTREGAEQ